MLEIMLAAGASPNKKRGDIHPLLEAIHHDRRRVVELLIAYGANVDLPLNYPPVIYLIKVWDRDDVLRILIDAGANLNIRTKRGESLIEFARRKGRVRCCEVLMGQ